MSAPRFVVLGLAPPRASWFAEVSRWATAGALPIEFVRCISADELRSRLAGGRAHSAALLDAAHPATDRDLIAACVEARCAPLVLAARAGTWPELGAAAVLELPLEAAGLGEALAAHARPVDPADDLALEVAVDAVPWRAPLLAITGTGGCGTSTLAIGLAERLASRNGHGQVLLADLARRADLALLHGTGTVLPGLPEVVERFRTGVPEAQQLRAMTFAVPTTGYDLLIGMRRTSEWTSLRPRAVAAALEGLRRTWDLVIADVDPDVEGQRATGSVDLEERNALSRAALLDAAVVVVATRCGIAGTAALVRTTEDLLEVGVNPAAIVPVVNRSPRGVGQREVVAAWASLMERTEVRPPLALPEVRRTEAVLRDVIGVPRRVTDPLLTAVDQHLARRSAKSRPEPDLVPVAPGSLGSWWPDGDDAEGDAA